MAQPMKVPAVKDLVVDDGVAPCPSHRSIFTLDGGIDLLPAPYIHKNDIACFCQTMPWHKP
jgi:hypothetical protein